MTTYNGTTRSILLFALIVAIAATLRSETVAPGASVYIQPMGGFEIYLAAAFSAKHVPVAVVNDPAKADFLISASAESEKPGWARTIFLKQGGSNEEASLTLIHQKSGTVVFAYATNKRNSVHGKQSAAEACAKHLAKFIKDGGTFTVAAPVQP